MTHNSLAASQRPNISLIDRRHFDAVALPIRTPERSTRGGYVNAAGPVRPLTAFSHINVPPYRRAPLLRASEYMRLLDRTGTNRLA